MHVISIIRWHTISRKFRFLTLIYDIWRACVVYMLYCVCIWSCMHAYMCVYMVWCMYAYMCVYMVWCMYAYMCVCMVWYATYSNLVCVCQHVFLVLVSVYNKYMLAYRILHIQRIHACMCMQNQSVLTWFYTHIHAFSRALVGLTLECGIHSQSPRVRCTPAGMFQPKEHARICVCMYAYIYIYMYVCMYITSRPCWAKLTIFNKKRAHDIREINSGW